MNAVQVALRERCAGDVFRTLATDFGEGSGGGGATRKRVCIATPDIVGPVKNGGIGTAYHHLARLLAGWGHEVVVAYVNGNADEEGLMAEARTFYEGFGVGFEPIVPRPASGTALAQVSAPTWALYDWLRGSERCFDILHVSDWHGLGYGALLAKSLGLALGGTHIVVHAHGPTLWNVEGNRQLLSNERELGWVFMERRSVELADTLVCGSAHLLGWMREAGYAMPARSFVWPNPFPAPERSPEAAAERATRDAVALEEVVFFGRLEPRKGLVLFVDAIDRLARQGRAPARVTFLGAAARRFDGRSLIGNCERDWPVEVRAISDRNAQEAVAYLSQPGRLAVLPSLQENSSLAVTECLHAGIPFLAAATGGTPELVAQEDRERALVAPEHIALGERIAALGAAPLRAVRPRWDFERSQEVWSRWHAQSAPFEAAAVCFAHRARRADAETPLVTVCITHYERPALLGMAVDSVFAQDYPALEAVLVDDGSESAEALAALVEIEHRFCDCGWRVIRQQNRYLGAARNAAAGAARGEWLLFLDDDNVLFPDAVTRLVRAARFSGAHCVPAASMRFTGDGDPRTDTASHGTPMRFLGAARAWSRFCNVVGDACALVRQDAFMAVGGFTEEYRVGLDDLSFFNRLILAGYAPEPLPDPVYFYRFGNTSMKSRNRSAETAQVRVLTPFLHGQPDEERAYEAFAAASVRDAITPSPSQLNQRPHSMALRRSQSRLGIVRFTVSALLDPTWVAHTLDRHGINAACELRCNARVVARSKLDALSRHGLHILPDLRIPTIRDVLLSLHDVCSGETLAAIILPTSLRARHVTGTLENRPRPEIRGWILDPNDLLRNRKIAIHLNGRLRKIVRANLRRPDIARWKGTPGHHGFMWRIPEDIVHNESPRIDVFDAETGRPLRGSPILIRNWRAVASK